MQSKWFVPITVLSGAVILILSAAIGTNVYLKIIGIIVLMFGIFKASKRVDATRENTEKNENR